MSRTAGRLESLGQVAARAAERRGAVRLTGLRGSARAVACAELLRAHGERPALIVTPTAKVGDALEGDLRTALGLGDDDRRLLVFPRHDTGPYDRFSPQPFVVAQRMEVLHRWRTAGSGAPAPVVVAPSTALALRVPSRALACAHTVELRVGQAVDREELVTTLLSAGYARVPVVEERGELAVRGGIVDLYPPSRAHPVRVELLGDDVESLREFDPASQRSQSGLESLLAPPARELLVDRDGVIERGDRIRALAEAQGVPPRSADELLDALLRGHVPGGSEALLPLLLQERENAFDFLPEDTLVVLDEPELVRQRLLQYFDEVLLGFDAARTAGRAVAPPEELFLAPDAIDAALRERAPVSLERLDVADAAAADERYTLRARGHEGLRRELVEARSRDRALAPLVDRLMRWCEEGWRAVITASTLSGAERLRHLLAEYGIGADVARGPAPTWRWSAPGRVELRVARISEGFALPLERLAVVCEEEIFGPRRKRRAAAGVFEAGAAEALAQLAPGDFLVHAEHGIGVYRGLVSLELGGTSGEFLRIDYAGGDRLFLPVHRLNLVQRYVGSDGIAPRIDRLGGQTWQRARRSVKRAVFDMARGLLAVHAARALAPGFAFSPRDRLLEEFEGRFPFEETDDQRTAIEEVLADLGRAKPMDRLVCGDVGYGKTEVAVRATFCAAMDGKQVAVLVPTTVLCQQHVETFRQRFEDTPVVVESLSRFRTPRQAREVCEGLASGRIDVVIGTHRLLQDGVAFRDLGLLVVDEEQRFGVAHKERIKQLKQTVDVLTLTATPIPRTLQMAFTGLRDLSVINTPPAGRLSIRTQVCRFSKSLIREAILREVRRGGQVFFVHNRVQSIGAMAELLRRAVPEVRIQVAHGQMRERELEDRMLGFLRGETDLLLSTAIVENGLDIPRVNTIIVNRADAFGLAQLYQLRGRVGRSQRRAYAYLLIPGEEAIGEDARRRLDAIQDLSELGSGFRLASMDLEIRGAGNLLGAEQSGNLAAVGYETYMEMLLEAIEELRGQPRPIRIDPEIRLPVQARLPEDYVPEVSQRLVLYKRLAGAPDEEDLARIRDELLDRFGALPPPAEHLLRLIHLKIRARELGIAAVDAARGELILTAAEHSRLDPDRLVRLAADPRQAIRLAPDRRILARAPAGGDPTALCDAAERLLASLAGADPG